MRISVAAFVLLGAVALSQAKYLGIYFGGQYAGKCGFDGYYYNDAASFVQCTAGLAYVQKCAPGSQNKPLQSYKTGYYYPYTVFCSEFEPKKPAEKPKEMNEVEEEMPMEQEQPMVVEEKVEEVKEMEVMEEKKPAVEEPAVEEAPAPVEPAVVEEEAPAAVEPELINEEVPEEEEVEEEVKQPDMGGMMPPMMTPYKSGYSVPFHHPAPHFYHPFHAYPFFAGYPGPYDYPPNYPYDNPYYKSVGKAPVMMMGGEGEGGAMEEAGSQDSA